MRFALAATAALAVFGVASEAEAQARESSVQRQQNSAMAEIPRCTRNLGTITIADGDNPYGWTQFNLASPQKLLKVMVQRSGCFSLIDRGAGTAAAERERELAYSGELQRGSNVGRGQIRAADYVLVAEVASQDANASGGAVAGIAGGVIGGRFGAAVGGLRVKKLEATTILSLTDVRTTETRAVEEGHAAKTDIGWGAGGGWGFGGAVGGGYEDTDIGRVVTLAFIQAYTNMVTNLGGLAADASQAAPRQAFSVRTATQMRRSPASSSTVVRSLDPGMRVFPLGAKEGMWWEIEDENGNTGWVDNTFLQPAG